MTPGGGGSEKFWTRRELGVKNFGSVLKEGVGQRFWPRHKGVAKNF